MPVNVILAKLKALRKNPSAGYVEESEVKRFNAMISELQGELRDPEVYHFRISDEKVEQKWRRVRGKGRQLTNEKFCDGQTFNTQVDGLWSYLEDREIVSEAKSEPKDQTTINIGSVTGSTFQQGNQNVARVQALHVETDISQEKKWWEIWWGQSIIFIVSGVIVGLIVWGITRYYDKPSVTPARVSQREQKQNVPPTTQPTDEGVLPSTTPPVTFPKITIHKASKPKSVTTAATAPTQSSDRQGGITPDVPKRDNSSDLSMSDQQKKDAEYAIGPRLLSQVKVKVIVNNATKTTSTFADQFVEVLQYSGADVTSVAVQHYKLPSSVPFSDGIIYLGPKKYGRLANEIAGALLDEKITVCVLKMYESETDDLEFIINPGIDTACSFKCGDGRVVHTANDCGLTNVTISGSIFRNGATPDLSNMHHSTFRDNLVQGPAADTITLSGEDNTFTHNTVIGVPLNVTKDAKRSLINDNLFQSSVVIGSVADSEANIQEREDVLKYISAAFEQRWQTLTPDKYALNEQLLKQFEESVRSSTFDKEKSRLLLQQLIDATPRPPS